MVGFGLAELAADYNHRMGQLEPAVAPVVGLGIVADRNYRKHRFESVAGDPEAEVGPALESGAEPGVDLVAVEVEAAFEAAAAPAVAPEAALAAALEAEPEFAGRLLAVAVGAEG